MPKMLFLLPYAFALASCTSDEQSVGDNHTVQLTDAPAVEFSTSGWSYANSTNPFLLTPDYLTNAMIHLVHILLFAKNKQYFEMGEEVAYTIVETMKPHEPVP